MRDPRTWLQLTRPLLGFDLETTSANPETARIVSMSVTKFPVDPDVPATVWSTLVNPGMPIPPESTAVHGITDERVRECRHCHGHPETCLLPDCEPWPHFSNLARALVEGFAGCDFAGKNILRFDLLVMVAEMRRAGVDWHFAGSRVLDVDRFEQLLCPRSLADLVRKYEEREMDGAHDATVDIVETMNVMTGQLAALSAQNPVLTVDVLHAMCWPGFIDAEGKFAFIDGVACVNFGKQWKGISMSKVDKGYYRWILKNNFARDTKEVARAALDGLYPVATQQEA